MKFFKFFAVFILWFFASAAVWADGNYDLFHPVPDDQLRNFTTDRPTKSNAPITVDAGHFQYESDLVNWNYDRSNSSGTTTSNIIALDPTFKVGLTQNTDLQLVLAPFNSFTSTNRATNQQQSAFGFGDITTRVKFNIMGNDSGDYALAIVPYVKAPTASNGIGNKHWEGGAYAPFEIELPSDWVLTFQTELDYLENAAIDGTHANYQNLVNIGHTVCSKDLNVYAEFWSNVDTDRNSPNQYTADFAATWLVRANLQLDTGINFGLNKAATDYQPYIGLSQRF